MNELTVLREFFAAFMAHNGTSASLARLCNARDAVLTERRCLHLPSVACTDDCREPRHDR